MVIMSNIISAMDGVRIGFVIGILSISSLNISMCRVQTFVLCEKQEELVEFTFS